MTADTGAATARTATRPDTARSRARRTGRTAAAAAGGGFAGGAASFSSASEELPVTAPAAAPFRRVTTSASPSTPSRTAAAAPAVDRPARNLVEHEARALLTRVARIRPFALSETTVPAASFTVGAQAAIERYLAVGRRELRARVQEFLAWLRGPEGERATAEEAHRRLVYLRLRFNVVLSHFDMFSEVQTQRSEHETGVFLAGLDAVASDALDLDGRPFEPPPVICYLQRGHGASIRRARTRLPGGGENPVAIIKVPRERMVG